MRAIFQSEGTFMLPKIGEGYDVHTLFRVDNPFVQFRHIGTNFWQGLPVRSSPPLGACAMYRYRILEPVRLEEEFPTEVRDCMTIEPVRLYQMLARQPLCQPGDLDHQKRWNIVLFTGPNGYPCVNAVEGIEGSWTASQTFRYADSDSARNTAAPGDLLIVPIDLSTYS